jgi:hypothetical protein
MSGFPFNLGPEGVTFPLSTNPYWSRVTLSQIQGESPKNYALLAFKPGLPLQASELNEIQEISVMNDTLSAAMQSSWPVYSPAWENEVYGPGWNGTTPLYPVFDGINTGENLVGITGENIIVRKGWYLVTVKSSGLKHWVYSNAGYTAAIPSAPNYQLGFVASYETVKPSNDPSLYDNSSGASVPNTGAPAGADRIKIKLSAPVWSYKGQTADFSAIVKKIDTGIPGTIFYMNNVPVPQE